MMEFRVLLPSILDWCDEAMMVAAREKRWAKVNLWRQQRGQLADIFAKTPR